MHRRYGVTMGMVVATLVVATVFAFQRLMPKGGSSAAQAIAEIPHSSGVDTLDAADAETIAPSDSTLKQYASEDSAWRATNAAPVTYASAAGEYVTWRPAPRQALSDRVFSLVNAGRFTDAANELASWIAKHPDDVTAIRELARLYNRMGAPDAALKRYRELARLQQDTASRLEYAQALLYASKYDDAATEFRSLLGVEPNRVDYRYGLARALAWGDHPREAERELALLSQQLPGDTTVESMLRVARAGFEPTAAEAASWLRSRPSYLPYRVAYARALAKDRRVEALAQYDTILRYSTNPQTLAEAAGAHATLGDSIGNARLLGMALAMAPADTGLRHSYAQALAWSGDRRGAIAQYGILLDQGYDSPILLERGKLYVWSGDYAHGAADLQNVVAREPSFDAYATLGDAYRWSGDRKRARWAYTQALAMKNGDTRVVAALDQIAREERIVYASAVGSDQVGLTSLSSAVSDNSGFLFMSTGLAYGKRVGRATVVSAGVETRRVGQRYSNAPDTWVNGQAVSAGISTLLTRGIIASARAGVVRHDNGGTVPTALVSLGTIWRPFRFTVEASTGPAYVSLMSVRTLAPLVGTTEQIDKALTARTLAATVTVPLHVADATAVLERTQLSDGNNRSSVRAELRVPLRYGLSALYSGMTMGYSAASNSYWDPQRYTAHAVGLELAYRGSDRLSFAVRALPGYGRSVERFATSDQTSQPAPSVFQLATSGEMAYRRKRWEAAVSGGYSRGREGGYQSANGALRVRLIW